ncbi:MAG: NrfD/PsrC family molybdoenzyme membrane anchor subunit [Candidatus Hodarchaeales archaeon]|jgi:molybdopterin-containing oxidoreductase family membrane subunit
MATTTPTKKTSLIAEHKSAEILLNPVTRTGKRYFAFVAILMFLVILAGFAYLYQIITGLVVTGMRDRVSWGAYVANFVFFIGVSHAGTFISAVLRVTDAQWRHPVTRLGELLTAFGLVIGAAMVLVDLGRLDRILQIFITPNFRSPILWDLLAITMYLSGSLLYLYLTLIPDFALMRDNLGKDAFFLKRWLWTILAMRWEGTDVQHKRLNLGIKIMAWILIPVMFTVHTVVSYGVGGVMLRPGWRSSVFGIYFVVGALFSGVASVVIFMFVLRLIYPEMKKIITERHFRNLGVMLLVLSLGYGYLTVSEYIGVLYSNPIPEYELLEQLVTGEFALPFWIAIGGGIIIPGIIIFVTRARSIRWLLVSAILINIGMWVKRYVIVVPSMARPWIAGPWGTYFPSIIEITIVIGSFSALILGIALAGKIFPLCPLWEILEDEEHRKALIEAGVKFPLSFTDQTFPLPARVLEYEKEVEKELLSLE